MSDHELLKFWLMMLLLTGATAYSFVYCLRSWRKNRLIQDTPTSRVRSASQGYVEFTGRGLSLANEANRAPLSGIPCPWWRYKIEERSWVGKSHSWTTIQSDTSSTLFILDDGTAQCMVDPRGAEVFAHSLDVWYGAEEWPAVCLPTERGVLGWLSDSLFTGGRYRYSEQRLQAHEPIYAIGSFRTVSNCGESAERAVAELLRGWKGDQLSLLARFDANHDGRLSAEEWEHARSQARDQVQIEVLADAARPALHLLCKPTDGREFFLSAANGEALARSFRQKAAAGLVAFIGSAVLLTWMFNRV